MKYRCAACDHEFDHSGDSKKPRCPRCMGIHDVQPLSKPVGKEEEKKFPKVPVVVVLLIAAGVGAYFLFHEGDAEDGTPTGGDLADRLVALGVPAEDVVIPFEQSEEIEKFATTASGDRDDEAGMKAILEHLGKLKKDGYWTPFPQREARAAGPLVASKLLEKMTAKGKTPYEATSYELACLLLAMARSLDLDAHMAQIHAYEGEKTPPDPGGKMGRFGVVIGEAKGESKPPLFDPYAQRSGDSARGDFEVLTDEDAISVYFGHQALAQLMEHNTAAAHQKNDLAVKLAPDMALHRVTRGLIFASAGAPTESLAEFEKAVKRRDDAVNRVNLADVLILTDPTGKKAEAEIQAALSTMPDYAKARASLGVIYYSRGEYEEAETELAIAERLDPSSAEVMMAWAGYYVRKGDGEAAVNKAEQAVRLAGETVSSLVALAGVYRATARFDEMRAALDKVYKLAGDTSMAREIKKMFGYDPEDEQDEEIELAKGDDDDAGPAGMELELGTQNKSPFGGSLKLGEGLGGGMGGGLGGGLGGSNGPGLGGGGLKLNPGLQGE